MIPPRALTIAGSDSGGGAGIQADLKTFTALNVYGMSAITAVTAQNTLTISQVHVLPPEMVAAQIDAVAEDIGVDAVKTGMLASAAIVETVAAAIKRHALKNVVVDPVMVAKSGDALLQDDAVEALRRHLLPLATLVTPNIPEAETLSGVRIDTEAALYEAAARIREFGAKNVLIKGGHAAGSKVRDVLFDGQQTHVFEMERIDTKNTHGTGCTLSAAIAAHLARGESIDVSVSNGIEFVQGAIRRAYALGSGHGPLNHTHMLF
jgi:hydroxymethylpyrimidine/phosphomethylpyrimidine kinase